MTLGLVLNNIKVKKINKYLVSYCQPNLVQNYIHYRIGALTFSFPSFEVIVQSNQFNNNEYLKTYMYNVLSLSLDLRLFAQASQFPKIFLKEVVGIIVEPNTESSFPICHKPCGLPCLPITRCSRKAYSAFIKENVHFCLHQSWSPPVMCNFDSRIGTRIGIPRIFRESELNQGLHLVSWNYRLRQGSTVYSRAELESELESELNQNPPLPEWHIIDPHPLRTFV